MSGAESSAAAKRKACRVRPGASPIRLRDAGFRSLLRRLRQATSLALAAEQVRHDLARRARRGPGLDQ